MVILKGFFAFLHKNHKIVRLHPQSAKLVLQAARCTDALASQTLANLINGSFRFL